MSRPLYIAKETGSTERGSDYVILQDGPAHFHVSITNKSYNSELVFYEYIENPKTMEELHNNIRLLENDLLKT